CNIHVSVKNEPIFEKCLTTLIKDNFYDKNTLTYIYEDSEDVYIPDLRIRPRVLINIKNPTHLNFSVQSSIIIYLKHYESLNQMILQLNNLNSLRAKYFIVLTEKVDLNIVFEILCDFDIIHVIIIDQTENERNLMLHSSDSCINGFFTRTEITINSTDGCDQKFVRSFLNQELKNLSGRTLHLLLHRNRLFPTLVDPYLHPHPGILIALIKLIGERTNARINNIDKPLTDDLVINKRTKDISLIYLLARATTDFERFDMSSLIYQDPVIWIVPKAAHMSTVKVIASMFITKTWIAVVLAFLLTSTSWYFLAKIEERKKLETLTSFSECILSCYALMVNVPSNTLPKTSPLRLLITFYTLFCMNAYVIFQTIMISLLLNPPRELGINTLEDMLKSGLTPVVSRLAHRQLNTSDHKIAEMILAKCEVTTKNITENLFNVAYYRNQSTHIGEELLSMYKKERDMVDIIRSFNGGVQDIELNVAIRKGHPFLFTINNFIRAAVENGLMEKLFSDVGKFKYSDVSGHQTSVITTEHITVMLIMWFIGLSVSTVAFFIEFAMKTVKRKLQ
ncbi:hypothetical protein ILUMI_22815, partial [Ignelater luminosus]